MKDIVRCGYCGSYVKNGEYMSLDEIHLMQPEEFDAVPLGYCPNAMAEHYEQNPQDLPN